MTEHPATPLVVLRDVTKTFPGVLANDRISLEIRAGEVHVLLGENGAGKSTLIGMLAGMQQPDGGTIEIGGRLQSIDSPAHALELGIGTVFQHRMLVPGLTVAENLLLGSPAWHRPRRKDVRARFEKACADFGITIDCDVPVGTLSLGEQQQVEIIRAVWRGGRVIVLDEPTAMLTPTGVAELGLIMGRMKAVGIGVVFITHHLDEALDFGDRMSILRRGRKTGELACADLRALPHGAAVEQIVKLMFGDGLGIGQQSRQARHGTGPRPFTKPRLYLDKVSARDARGRTLLHDISFDVKEGEIFGIAGVDGNGQTALAEAIAGQLATLGTIAFDGQSVTMETVRQRSARGIRYITDDRLGEGTVGSLSVALNLLLKRIGIGPYWSHGLEQGAAVRDHARDLIAAFDIRTPSPLTPIGRLSGGNIQKALIARELHGGARFMIYNKPTHGLDLLNIEITRRRILEEAEKGMSTLVISTDLDEILALCDRIGVMVRGRLVDIVENGPDARHRVGTSMAGAQTEAAPGARAA